MHPCSTLVALAFACGAAARLTCTVPHVGAGHDDGPAINAAFQRCAKSGRVVLDQYYSVDSLLLTTGLDDVEVELSGTVQYTPDIAKWSPQSYYLTYQNSTTFWFLSGNNIHIYGGGTIDGNGQVWYDALASSNNKATAGASTLSFARPIPLTIGNSTNVVVENLFQIASPNWVSITLSSLSYTHDGWDIYRSSQVTITNSTINNDDDCVSLKPNSTDVVYAGDTDIVADVTVRNVTMRDAQNGARIKVFGGSPDPDSTAGGGVGFVRNVTFVDFTVVNVDNPIVVDQCYMTAAATCAEFPSTLTISDVHFINVTGTSSGKEKQVVVDIECSAECADITATGTDIQPPSGSAEYVCANVASTDEVRVCF
ncbi:glycoside hydrolase family 28 protein [Phlebiopsis gigantea 11061_1 CR5-6]|uniref:galacturonan 1,4-alpha-galacturonidase n=1 Tax=Phlebiopsis gigantea (strain 11061_1 CR5-6) TaxID=745531 RepID=A0A0C3NFB5_PHLG1|nr:glycoside hydrolase family 28 protein [Phlebiopsis gigantea 11061_1 CR5-6]